MLLQSTLNLVLLYKTMTTVLLDVETRCCILPHAHAIGVPHERVLLDALEDSCTCWTDSSSKSARCCRTWGGAFEAGICLSKECPG
jgi:hypothetical protein